MRRLRRYLLTGIIVTLPTVVTIWLLWRIVAAVDGILDPVQHRLYGMDIPGVGLAVVFVVLLVAGAVGGNYLGRKLVGFYHLFVARVPLAGKVYRAVQQILDVFLRDNTQSFKSVVTFEYPRPGTWVLGFVAAATPPGWTTAPPGERLLNVFVPTAPNPTSGYLLLVPERDLRIVDLSIENALKVIISGGALVPGSAPVPPPAEPRP